MLFDEDDEELYDDQTLVDNTEYHSERALVKAVAKKIRYFRGYYNCL